ncbi:MAG: ankyrin repeat domain-containing protein, partial [Chlamydiia bacterium]|nr:ankyrin repeat domain-containing protein [Chlamydiia bacterium]
MQKLMDRSGPRCLDLINQDGDNILHVAAHFHKKEVCDLIINKVDSSYLGLQDRSGNTALHTAIYGSSRDSHSIPCQLVDQMNPADLSLLNSNSFTPLMLCIKFSHSHGISDACKLIERMRTEDLLRPNEGSDTYLKE